MLHSIHDGVDDLQSEPTLGQAIHRRRFLRFNREIRSRTVHDFNHKMALFNPYGHFYPFPGRPLWLWRTTLLTLSHTASLTSSMSLIGMSFDWQMPRTAYPVIATSSRRLSIRNLSTDIQGFFSESIKRFRPIRKNTEDPPIQFCYRKKLLQLFGNPAKHDFPDSAKGLHDRHDAPQTGRIHEIDARKVQDDSGGSPSYEIHHMGFEPWGCSGVQPWSLRRNNRYAIHRFYINLQISPPCPCDG